MFAGLACWVIGIWGSAASLAEAALPPPYTAEFFAARLKEWTLSLQPAVIVPFIIVAIGSTIAWAKRHREPARTEDQVSIWWLVAFIGALTVVTGKEIPYYRFMNASAAPMALLGLGSYATIRWFFTDRAPSKWIGWGGVGLMLWAVAAWVKPDMLSDAAPVWIFTSLLLIGAPGGAARVRGRHPAADDRRLAGCDPRRRLDRVDRGRRPSAALGLRFEPVGEPERADVAGRRARGGQRRRRSTDRPSDERRRTPRGDVLRPRRPATHTNTAYGWTKTFSNVFRTGLSGDQTERAVTYLGTVQNFLAGQPTTSSTGSAGYDDAALSHFCEAFPDPNNLCASQELPEDFVPRFEEFPEPPVVFVIKDYYDGLCSVQECPADDPATPANELQDAKDALFQQAMDDGKGVEVGPGVYVLTGDSLWAPPTEVVDAAQSAAEAKGMEMADHPGALANWPHNLLVIALLAFLLIVPGWLASGWFGVRTTMDRMGLIPGMSVVMLMLSGIGVLAIWRGSLTTAKGWVVVAVAIGLGARCATPTTG